MEKSQELQFESQQREVLDNFVKLMVTFDKSQVRMEKMENVLDGIIVHNGFSKEECEYLINGIKYNEDVEYKNTVGEVYRKNLRLQIDHSDLACQVYERIKAFLPSEYEIESNREELGAFSKGKWAPSCINPRFRICKYLNYGHFGAHYDGCFIKSQDDRSFLTIMFYLNEEYEGGETVFLDRESGEIKLSLKPTTGMMVIFPQDVWHEGKAVQGEKYIFRTDILFKRICENELPPEELSKKKLALEYLQLAQELERSRQGREAVEYYRKAFKLDPDLEKVIY